MKKLLVAAITIAGLAAPALSGAQELPRRLGGENGPKKAAEAAKPAPKLADGTVDLSGIWTGGGDAPIPRLLKKGELETLLQPWAKQKMASIKEADDPYFYCMPGGPLRITGGFAWRLVQPAGERSKLHLHAPGRERAQFPADLHGRPKASGRSVADVVWPLDWPLGGSDSRHRYGRPQRQVLARQRRNATHRATAPHRALHADRLQHAAARRDDRGPGHVHQAVHHHLYGQARDAGQ